MTVVASGWYSIRIKRMPATFDAPFAFLSLIELYACWELYPAFCVWSYHHDKSLIDYISILHPESERRQRREKGSRQNALSANKTLVIP